MIKISRSCLYISLLFLPANLYASFIEATIGTAVVNDATATYYNPAALTLVKTPQVVGLGSIAYFRTQFSGQVIQPATGLIQSGSARTNTHYYLPSVYLGVPLNDKMTVGIAVVSNFFNSDIEQNSVLRYVQSSHHIQDVDLVLGVGSKVDETLSFGVGINITHAKFLLEPISGAPAINIPDSQSRNETTATSYGKDVGILLKPANSTLIGFDYRSAVTYNMSGTSTFEGNPVITSNNYHFKFWTPAKSVLSINHFVTSTLGFIGTVQYIQWNIFKNINIHNIATPLGIIANASVPYHLHNSWIFTIGTHYRMTPNWIVRLAGSYIQSPANANYQISNGDSTVLGGSTSYELNKNITVDGSYAHAFIKNKNIHIITTRNIVDGINKGSRDSVSLKLTLNI